MVRRRLFTAALLACALPCACTALLGIDDVPYESSDAEATADRNSGTTSPDSDDDDHVDSGTDPNPPDVTTSPRDAIADACPHRDATNTTGLSSCVGRVNGKYCGSSDQLNPATGAYPNPNDLVICVSNAIAVTQPCSKCIPMTGGHSDECNPCDCLPNGFYCGRDLAGWNAAANGDTQVHCVGGAATAVKLCTSCVTGAQTTCT